MASNTQKLQRSGDQIIAPQYYNQGSDVYEVSQGTNGATYVQGYVKGPMKIMNAPYTMWTSNGQTNWPASVATLSRNAKARTFFFINNLGVNINVCQTHLYESTISDGSSTYGETVTFYPPSSGSKSFKTSEDEPGLAMHVDSLVCTVTIGTSVPTSGTLDLYVIEIF